MTLVALVTQAAGIYCLESLNPAFAHIWVRQSGELKSTQANIIFQVMVIEGCCVTIAMYCLIQFYVQLKDDLAEHRPLLKISAIKLVIFLSFWQSLLISFLTSSGAINPSETLDFPDIKIGIPSLLLCIEMAIFSVFHLWAFPWQVYDINRSHIVASESAPGFLPDPKTAYQGGHLGLRALADAFNPWDFVKAIGRAFKWITVGRKHRMEDRSYNKATPGAGLEPTRNQFTAFSNYGGSNPYDEGGGGSGAFEPELTAYTGTFSSSSPGESPKAPGAGRYHQLTRGGAGRNDDDEDEDALLSSAQSNPISAAYPRPMERLPNSPRRGATPTQTTSGGPQTPKPSHARTPSSPPLQHLAPPYPLSPTTTASSNKDRRTPSMESQTHSLSHSSLTPDLHPLGPPGGRKSSEQEEWQEHDGSGDVRARGESEVVLGGGHGVRDNRF